METNLGQERELEARVRLDQVDEVRRAQTAQEFADVRSDEPVVHDRRVVVWERVQVSQHTTQN
jgi:hypothetical protein